MTGTASGLKLATKSNFCFGLAARMGCNTKNIISVESSKDVENYVSDISPTRKSNQIIGQRVVLTILILIRRPIGKYYTIDYADQDIYDHIRPVSVRKERND